MPDLGWPEILIIAFVVLVLFGSRKLPDAARSLGRSLRIFKAETKGLRHDDDAEVRPEEKAAIEAARTDVTAAATAPEPPVARPPAGSEPR
jgi:sec-independent protein translocase protein TatA